MNCADARQRILIADLATVPGDSDPELSDHLAGCEQCRRVAAVVANGTVGLGMALRRRRRAVTRRYVTLLTAVPIAAALILAIVLTRPARPHDAVAVFDGPPAEKHVSVDVARGQQATVLKTADPNVTLIWLTPGAGQ